jgi:hypothetical protein
MTAAKTPLAPIIKTVMAKRIIHGGRGVTQRSECWGARTTDGVWDFEREESPGTPWVVIHRETRETVHLCGTLRGCRWFVAAGHAQAALERQQAHERGQHAAQRDSWCVKC